MGQDPITNPLFDPGGNSGKKEEEPPGQNRNRRTNRGNRGGNSKHRRNKGENEQKDRKSSKGGPSKGHHKEDSDQKDETNPAELNPIHKLLNPRPQTLGVKVAQRPPRKIEKQMIIDSELRRIRALESAQDKNAAPNTAAGKTTGVVRKQRGGSKHDRKKVCGADSNRNLTKDEEFILEHVTAFVFRRRHVKPPAGDHEKPMTKENQPNAAQMARWETELQHEHIKRISPQNVPNYCVEFHCAICLIQFDNVYQALSHYKDKSHKSIRKQLNDLDCLLHLRRKFDINPDRMAVLNAEINDTLKRIKHVDLNAREDCFQRVQNALSKAIPNCGAELYGSSFTQTCLPESDVNIVIYMAETRPNKLLSRALALFTQMEQAGEQFHAVSEHFYSSSNNNSSFTPNVKFIDDATGIKVTLIAADNSNTPRIKTANLMKFYLDLEPKINDLALLFRQWGNWCALDAPEDGSIPAYAFTLCVIYFFQRQKWCPVLHDLTECRTARLPVVQRDDRWFYHPIKTVDKTSVSSALDDEPISMDGDEDAEVITEDGESIEPPSEEPVTVDGETSDMDDISEVDTDQLVEIKSTLPKELTLAQILIQFFEFFAFQFEMEEKVVSVRNPKIVSRSDKGWGSRRIAIEDPYQMKRNICRTLNSQMIFEYFRTRLRATLMRFRIGPNELRQIVHSNEAFRTNAGDSDKSESLTKKKMSESDDTDAGLKSVFVEDASDRVDPRTQRILNKAQQDMKKLQIAERKAPKLQIGSKLLDSINSYLRDDPKRRSPGRETPPENEKPVEEEKLDEVEKSAEEEKMPDEEKSSEEAKLAEEVKKLEQLMELDISDEPKNPTEEEKPVSSQEEESAEESSTSSAGSTSSGKSEEQKEDEEPEWIVKLAQRKEQVIKQLQVVFDDTNISGGLMPVKVCQLCKNEGHYVADCPDDPNKHTLVSLPELSDAHYDMLDQVLEKVYAIHCPSDAEIDHREKALQNLQNFMAANFDANCELKLFGSSRNGFGFRGSDMDLCLTFKNHDEDPPPLFSNAVQVIKQLTEVLKQNDLFKNVVPITAAKVPIVKFEYLFRGTLYEGDISYYNVLAQRNTKLLSLYATLDTRCQKLGYVLKAMVKKCGVGDASRGSLSSYAYVLLLIHYLQQIEVLPVLQELYEEPSQPVHTVEGFNTWFQEDRETIAQLFSCPNDHSLSRIWIGFLQYYTEHFKFDQITIQIRHKTHLTTFEKEWTSKCISIEDPFELTHNLGCGVSRKMANYILKVFQRARGIFGRFNLDIFADNNWQFDLDVLAQGLFSCHLLTDGDEVPNDRCCRICGKIGHFVKDCPQSRRNHKKNQNGNIDMGNNGQKCYACNEMGHFAKNCPNRRNGRKNRAHDDHDPQSPMRQGGKFPNDHYRRSPRGNWRQDRHREDRRVYQTDNNYAQDNLQPLVNPLGLQHEPVLSPGGNPGRKYFYNPGNHAAGQHARAGNRTRLNSDTRREYQNRPPTRPRTKTD